MSDQAQQPTQKRRGPRRWWKWTRRVIVALFLLMVLAAGGLWGVAAYFNWRGEKAWAEATAEVRRRGLPTSRQELTERLQAANRPLARYLKAGFGLWDFPEEFSYLPVGGAEGQWPVLGQRIPPDVAELSREYIAEQADYFALLEKAREHDERLPWWDLFEFPRDLQGVRAAAKSWADASVAAQADGDSERVTQCCANALWMSRTLDTQPALITGLVRVAIDSIAVGTIEQAISRCPLEEVHLEELYDSLREEDSAMDLAGVYRGEIAVTLDAARLRDTWLAKKTAMNIQVALWLEAMSQKGYVTGIPGTTETFSKMRLTNAAAWAWRVICPAADKLMWANELKDEVASLDWASRPTPEIAAAICHDPSAVGQSGGALRMLLQGKATVRVAAAGVAVERYRLQHGDWPADLAGAGADLPTDPFTGQALVFKRTNEGVVVYSVGANLTDDGGENEHLWQQGKDDITFRLLDPALRNRP